MMLLVPNISFKQKLLACICLIFSKFYFTVEICNLTKDKSSVDSSTVYNIVEMLLKTLMD
jgi:hypothetical protein